MSQSKRHSLSNINANTDTLIHRPCGAKFRRQVCLRMCLVRNLASHGLPRFLENAKQSRSRHTCCLSSGISRVHQGITLGCTRPRRRRLSKFLTYFGPVSQYPSCQDGCCAAHRSRNDYSSLISFLNSVRTANGTYEVDRRAKHDSVQISCTAEHDRARP